MWIPSRPKRTRRAGAAKLEKDLHLFRNFEHLHWVLTVPSVKDAATGKWKGGDLDGDGDAPRPWHRGQLHLRRAWERRRVRHAINIFKIQPNPEKQPPVQVGEIPAMVEGNQGYDDRELRALVYTTSTGQDRYLLVRNGGTNTAGKMDSYRIDPNTCQPIEKRRMTFTRSRTSSFCGTIRSIPIVCSST